MATLIDINPTAGYVTAGDGKFDTRNRYIRKSASGTFPIVKGQTIVCNVATPGNRLNWRFSVGTFARSYTFTSNTPISYDPSYTLVTL